VDTTATTPTWGSAPTAVEDYRFTIARGCSRGQLTASNGGPTGTDRPVQFYGELYLPQVGQGLDIKFGGTTAIRVRGIDTTRTAGVRAYNFIYNRFNPHRCSPP